MDLHTEKGYFRVISRRGDREFGPDPDEVVIDMDRSHPVLGNPHILRDKNDSLLRSKVIAAHRADLIRDVIQKGPMFTALLQIAMRIKNGEKVCGRCWCYPRPCHLDAYAVVICEIVGALSEVREVEPVAIADRLRSLEAV